MFHRGFCCCCYYHYYRGYLTYVPYGRGRGNATNKMVCYRYEHLNIALKEETPARNPFFLNIGIAIIAKESFNQKVIVQWKILFAQLFQPSFPIVSHNNFLVISEIKT